MTVVHIAVLILRIFAVLIAYFSIQNFVYAFNFYSDDLSVQWLGCVVALSPVLVALFIWFLPYSVVSLLAGKINENDKQASPVTLDQFTTISYLILVVYLSFHLVSDSVYWFSFSQAINSNELISVLTEDQKASINATLAEAVFVLFLIVGRKKIIQAFKAFRQL